jgi:hypothetical protein
MRELTLHEKITLKGILCKRFAHQASIPRLDMRAALHYWNMMFGKSIAEYWRFS